MARPALPSILRNTLVPPLLLRSQTWPHTDEHQKRRLTERRSCPGQDQQRHEQQEELLIMQKQRQQQEIQRQKANSSEDDALRRQEQQPQQANAGEIEFHVQHHRIQDTGWGQHKRTKQQERRLMANEINLRGTQQNSVFTDKDADMHRVSEGKTSLNPAGEVPTAGALSAAPGAAVPVVIPTFYDTMFPSHPASAVTESQRSNSSAASAPISPEMEPRAAAAVAHAKAKEADAAAGPASAGPGGDVTAKVVRRTDETICNSSEASSAISPHVPPPESNCVQHFSSACERSLTLDNDFVAAGEVHERAGSNSSSTNNTTSVHAVSGNPFSGRGRTCNAARTCSVGDSSNHAAGSGAEGSCNHSTEMIGKATGERVSSLGDDDTSNSSESISEKQKLSRNAHNIGSSTTDSSNSSDDGGGGSRKNDYIVHSMDEKTITFTYKGFLFSSVTRRKKHTTQRGDSVATKVDGDTAPSAAVSRETVTTISSTEQETDAAGSRSLKLICIPQTIDDTAAMNTSTKAAETASLATTAATAITRATVVSSVTPTATTATITATGATATTAGAFTSGSTNTTVAATLKATITAAGDPLQCMLPGLNSTNPTNAIPQAVLAASQVTEEASSTLARTSSEAHAAGVPAANSAFTNAYGAAAISRSQTDEVPDADASFFWNVSPRERRSCCLMSKKAAAAEATAAFACKRYEAARRERLYEAQRQQHEQTKEEVESTGCAAALIFPAADVAGEDCSMHHERPDIATPAAAATIPVLSSPGVTHAHTTAAAASASALSPGYASKVAASVAASLYEVAPAPSSRLRSSFSSPETEVHVGAASDMLAVETSAAAQATTLGAAAIGSAPVDPQDSTAVGHQDGSSKTEESRIQGMGHRKAGDAVHREPTLHAFAAGMPFTPGHFSATAAAFPAAAPLLEVPVVQAALQPLTSPSDATATDSTNQSSRSSATDRSSMMRAATNRSNAAEKEVCSKVSIAISGVTMIANEQLRSDSKSIEGNVNIVKEEEQKSWGALQQSPTGLCAPDSGGIYGAGILSVGKSAADVTAEQPLTTAALDRSEPCAAADVSLQRAATEIQASSVVTKGKEEAFVKDVNQLSTSVMNGEQGTLARALQSLTQRGSSVTADSAGENDVTQGDTGNDNSSKYVAAHGAGPAIVVASNLPAAAAAAAAYPAAVAPVKAPTAGAALGQDVVAAPGVPAAALAQGVAAAAEVFDAGGGQVAVATSKGPAAAVGVRSNARVEIHAAGIGPEEAVPSEDKNKWTTPAVEDFMLQLRRGELRGSHQTARRTAEVLRQVVDQHPWKTTQELVDIIKQLGRRFLRADPMEFLVSNVVRRILCIIRTEHYKQLRKRQPEDEDDDERFDEQQQLLQGLGGVGSTGAHGDMTRLPLLPSDRFRTSPLRSTGMHAASPFPGFPSRTTDDPQQLLLPVPATVKHSIFEGISELVAEVDAAWEEGEDVRTACFSNGDCILTYGYSVAVERLLKALHRKNQGEGATHSSRKKMRKGRVRCSFQVLVLGGDIEQGGKKMAERLVAAGIKTAYVADAALLTVIHKVDKVLLGTRAILSSGGAVAVSGARYVAEAAKIYNRPVMVVAPLFKLTHLPLYDQHTRNQLLSPSAVLPDLPELKNVSVRIPKYDYIPDNLLAVFITEIGPVDPSCLFVLAQQRYDVEDLDLYAVV